MSWLPRISIHGWCSCSADGEYEGRSIEIAWGPLLIELAFGMFDRRVEDPCDNASEVPARIFSSHFREQTIKWGGDHAR